MTERFAKQIYDTIGDDLQAVQKLLVGNEIRSGKIEKIPALLHSLSENKKKDLAYLKEDMRQYNFLLKIVLRMKSGLVDGMEASNIWIDYGDILEVE